MQNMDYYQISAEELGKNSKIPILKLSDSGEVFYELALEMKETIEKNNQAGRHTVFICPVGPVGQYPIFVRLVNRDRVSLKNCWFINMDEYLNDDETYISEDSPLSFRGFMKRSVYEKIAGRTFRGGIRKTPDKSADNQPRNKNEQCNRRQERRD